MAGSGSNQLERLFAMDKIRTIRLYGKLGNAFGRVHKAAVKDTRDAIQYLCAMVPGFEQELMQRKGVGYAVFIGKQNLKEDQLEYPPGNDDIRIAPVVLGAKRGGLFSIILGAALIVGAPYLAGALWGTSATAAVWVASNLPTLGWALAIGGVAQMLSPSPAGLGTQDRPENGASYNFNGPVNTTAQGNPVPVLYGEMFIGSATVSAGIYTEDQQ